MYINSVTVCGNLTRDPELKALPSGQNVCSLSLATNKVWTKDGERKESTEFHNVIVFGKQAENTAKYLTKGSQALVQGELQTRNWEKDGVKHYRTEIVAQSIQFGAKPSNAPAANKSESVLPDYPNEEVAPEDIPF